MANEETIKNSLRDIIGDTIYYENVIEEEINKRDGNDTERAILIKILSYGKNIMAEREEKEKNRVRNAYEQEGCTVTVKENEEQGNANSIKSIESKIEENQKNGTEPRLRMTATHRLFPWNSADNPSQKSFVIIM